MKMNKLMIAAIALCAGVASAQLPTTNFDFTVNQTAPDGNPIGMTLETNLTVLGDSISALTLSLDITGGKNSDLYVTLAGPNGGFSVLLNRVGMSSTNSAGYNDAGLNITFDDAAANGDIHFYQNVGGYAGLLNGGSWQPDGRNIDPASAPAAFDSASRGAMLGSFLGSDPNGTWTLFVADMSGGAQSTLVSWGLVMTIPEPSSLALLGTGLFGFLAVRRRHRSQIPD